MQTNEADCSFTITVQDNTDCGCSNPQPGDSCDDGDPQTDNDVVQADCSCVGVSCDIAITSVTETDETCPGEEDGTITINASCTSCDGILYSIDGGATTQASPTFTGLATGSYQPYVEDSGDDTCNDVDTDVVISTEADTEAPDMVCRKATIEIEIGQILTAAQVDSNSTDNCAITQLSVAPNVFGCGNVGSNTVTLTAADAAGNLNTCTATVNVVDNVDPEALCQNTTVQLDANGQGSITAGDIDNGSNDACGIASLSLDNSDFTCSDLGNGNTVTLTVTDNNGNPSTCTATVTVEDNEAPTAICLSTTVLIQPDGTYTLQEADVFDAANSFDNCAITQVNFPAATYTCDDVFQTFPVNVTISDAAGNSDNCTASVYVEIGTALPAGWSASDIGQVTVGNEYTYDPCAGPTGEFTVTGSGNNGISTTTDNVAFAGQTLCGDGMITAKIESITPNGYGGLMIRETTAAGSKQVSIFSNLTNVLRHEVRAMTNGPKQIQSFYKPFPFWLRLQRQGNWILTYYSTTGGNFQYIHAEFMPMQGCVEIGLASFTYLPNAQTDAVFSNVSISGSAALIDAGGLPTAELGDSQQMEPELFPNPTNSQFTLRFPQALQGEATASLRNQVGQVLQQRQLQPGDMTTEWNVSQLPAGLYFMEVRQEGVPPQVLRVVKQ